MIREIPFSFIQLPVWEYLKVIYIYIGFAGLYRGYFSTVIREIPFSFIQFPVWEYLKVKLIYIGFAGLYRGYFSTVIIEIPFFFIQFPVWEYLRVYGKHSKILNAFLFVLSNKMWVIKAGIHKMLSEKQTGKNRAA